MRSTPPSALLISPAHEDSRVFHELFTEKGWSLQVAASLAAASNILPEVSVVITEAELAAGTWRDVLGAMSFLPNPPLLIVTSIHADEHLWVEALNLGAYDVLAKPFDKAEVTRVLMSAWMRYRGKALGARRAG